MTVKISECVRCGRPAGIVGREHCARCRYALAHRPARNQFPGCGQPRKLDEVTGKCVLCSRTCVRCGGKIGRIGREICSLCLVKDRRAAAQQPCPRCGKPGRIREATGWCGPCSHPGRTPSPDAACRACGLVTHLAGDGLCSPCYTRSPHRITVRAENLAARLSDPPRWLPGFADYLVPGNNATAACQMITGTGRLLRDGGPVHSPCWNEPRNRAGRWPARWRTSSPAMGSPCRPTTPSTGPPAAGSADWTPSPPSCGPP